MESQPRLHFRPASEDDFAQCLALDHSYETERIWQLSVSEKADARQISFQVVRLPQKKQVPYPYAGDALVQRWCACEWFWVAEENGRLQAYITAAIEKLTAAAWIYDMVVAPAYRRQGYGSHMLALAAAWAKEQQAQQLLAAVATKNDPAMNFFRHNGFNFCGYNEASYRIKDISLFFSGKVSSQ